MINPANLEYGETFTLMQSLNRGAEFLMDATRYSNSPPVFLLNANRDKVDTSITGADNRYEIQQSDLPTAQALQKAGIHDVIVLSDRVMHDLIRVLQNYKNIGIGVCFTNGSTSELYEFRAQKWWEKLLAKYYDMEYRYEIVSMKRPPDCNFRPTQRCYKRGYGQTTLIKHYQTRILPMRTKEPDHGSGFDGFGTTRTRGGGFSFGGGSSGFGGGFSG
jgi:uncharacterized membrane protein YgcG